MLDWRTITPSHDPKHWVKGTELEVAICGRLSRYQIVAVRCYLDRHYKEPDRHYIVRDAHTVSDADIRNGIRPKIVATFDTENEAIKYCNENEY